MRVCIKTHSIIFHRLDGNSIDFPVSSKPDLRSQRCVHDILKLKLGALGE